MIGVRRSQRPERARRHEFEATAARAVVETERVLEGPAISRASVNRPSGSRRHRAKSKPRVESRRQRGDRRGSARATARGESARRCPRATSSVEREKRPVQALEGDRAERPEVRPRIDAVWPKRACSGLMCRRACRGPHRPVSWALRGRRTSRCRSRRSSPISSSPSRCGCMFSGLRSRCTMPLRMARARPRATCEMMLHGGLGVELLHALEAGGEVLAQQPLHGDEGNPFPEIVIEDPDDVRALELRDGARLEREARGVHGLARRLHGQGELHPRARRTSSVRWLASHTVPMLPRPSSWTSWKRLAMMLPGVGFYLDALLRIRAGGRR